MLKVGSLWIRLWEPSDVVMWMLTTVFAGSLLAAMFYCGRKRLERRLSMGQMDCLLKLLIVYLLCIQPAVTMLFLYRGIFDYTGPSTTGSGNGFLYEYNNLPISTDASFSVLSEEPDGFKGAESSLQSLRR